MSRIALFPVMAGRNGGGPETYERELARGLAAIDTDTDYRVTCLNEAAGMALATGAPNFQTRIIPGRLRPVAMTFGLQWLLRREKIDLMHAAYIAPPWSPVRYVFTLHCSSPFAVPELFPPAIRARLLFLIRCGMRDAAHIICVSQDVLERAREHYGVPSERMTVVYNGVGSHFRAMTPEERAPVLERYGLSGRYIFTAARFEKRKNLARLLQAFARYHREVDPECRLALAGDMTWEAGPLGRLIAELGLDSAVQRLGYVANHDLPAIYGGAVFFAFPSIWEGFGLPVIEAMASGTPVLTSNTSSLPEVAGNAAILVDPHSTDAIADGMARLGSDAALRTRLSAVGQVHAARFSWAQTAKETLEVYRRQLP
jgi:glycosyltransferase involved in cell wall biosynthesis